MPNTTLDYMMADGGFIDAARALHWYCVHYHEGQTSDQYAIQCQLGYSPSCLDSGHFYEDEETPAGDIYGALIDGDIDPQELLDAIQAASEAWNG